MSKYFWADVINTACHVLKRAVIRSILENTSYELLKGRKPNISYFRVFSCKCCILNNRKDNHGKFDAKFDEGMFLGYSSSSKAYKVYNHRMSTLKSKFMLRFINLHLKRRGKVFVMMF